MEQRSRIINDISKDISSLLKLKIGAKDYIGLIEISLKDEEISYGRFHYVRILHNEKGDKLIFMDQPSILHNDYEQSISLNDIKNIKGYKSEEWSLEGDSPGINGQIIFEILTSSKKIFMLVNKASYQ